MHGRPELTILAGPTRLLIAIKLLHTVVWAFMAGCILALPVTGRLRRFRWSGLLSGIILMECAVLAVNAGRCPLTDVAARYTTDRSGNFDIYLPNWLAIHNKQIFGILFVVGEVIVLGYWLTRKRSIDCKKSQTNSRVS